MKPEDSNDFKGCCEPAELDTLVDCYNIFFTNTEKKDIVNVDFCKALVAYYYNLVVFEYYMPEYSDRMYLQVVYQKPAEEEKLSPNNIIVKDNQDTMYIYEYKEGDDLNSEMVMVGAPFMGLVYYIHRNWNPENGGDPKMYYDKNGTKPAKMNIGFDCLRKFGKESKDVQKFYQSLVFENYPENSKIRKLILGMNPEPFIGGKKYMKKNTKKYVKKNTKKYVKKNKRTLKKYIKKSRKK